MPDLPEAPVWKLLRELPDPGEPGFAEAAEKIERHIQSFDAKQLDDFVRTVFVGSKTGYVQPSFEADWMMLGALASDPKGSTAHDMTDLSAGHQWAVDRARERKDALANPVDTGHYDDGHAFGWKQRDVDADDDETDEPRDVDVDDDETDERRPEPAGEDDDMNRPLPPNDWQNDRDVRGFEALASPPGGFPKNVDTDTGHYDDGHAFGWKSSKPGVLRPMTVVALGFAGLVLVGGLVFFNRPATVVSDVASAAPVASAAQGAGANAPAASARPTAIDPCALITVAESSSILERPVTQTLTTPGLQCTYQPQPAATWSLPEASRTAKIRIDSVLITVASGADAQSRYAAKQAIFGKDPTSDDVVQGLGDKAIFTGGTEVSVLSGTKFINVRATGDYDWGEGNNRYEDVHQKLIAVLSAFAKVALPRM